MPQKLMSLVNRLARKRAEKLTPAANLRTPRKPMFQVKRLPERRMSRVLEKTERLRRAVKLQILGDPRRSSTLSSGSKVKLLSSPRPKPAKLRQPASKTH